MFAKWMYTFLVLPTFNYFKNSKSGGNQTKEKIITLQLFEDLG